MRKVLYLTTAMAMAAFSTVALAQQSERSGRYTMSPAEGGGVVRLDTLTGAMSLCRSGDDKWTCQEMSDVTGELRQKVEKLEAENARLKSDVERLEAMLLPNQGDKPAKPRLELPSEQDLDRAMTYLQRMFRKFQDKLDEFEQKQPPKQPPAGPSTPL